MKRGFLVMIASILALAAVAVSCKGEAFKDLAYEDVGIYDWLQASVKKKDGARVVWFQVFDQVDDKSIAEGYANSGETFDKYPAKIYDGKWIWILVNNRIEIRLIADDAATEFKNTEMLKSFIRAFDLDGMAKVTGPKVSAKELEKFIPKLGGK